jgi:hypothetical protein
VIFHWKWLNILERSFYNFLLTRIYVLVSNLIHIILPVHH